MDLKQENEQLKMEIARLNRTIETLNTICKNEEWRADELYKSYVSLQEGYQAVSKQYNTLVERYVL